MIFMIYVATVHEDKLQSFNVPMLKKMCTYFEISFRSTDKKADLLTKLREIIMSCQCCTER